MNDMRVRLRELGRKILLEDKNTDGEMRGIKLTVFYHDGTFEEYNSRQDKGLGDEYYGGRD